MRRETVSLIVFFSFFGLIVSSLALYTWEFAGFNKKFWTNLHITGGLLFIAAGVWHTLTHLKTVWRYMAGSPKKTAARCLPLAFAAILSAGVYTTTVLHTSPMRQVIELFETLKSSKSSANKAKAPEGVSLEAFCKELALDPAVAAKTLQTATGMQGISPGSSLRQLSQQSGVPVTVLVAALLGSGKATL